MNKATIIVRRLASFACLLWARPRVRVFLLVCAASFLAVFATLSVSFSYERHQREAEMAEMMPTARRSPAEIRGLMNAMIRDRLAGHDNAPALIPQSMWDDAACAGAVIAMVNFIIGENDYLRSTSAWRLEQDNPGRVELLYDREQSGDYRIDDETINETHDRVWWFSRLRRFVDVGQGSARTSGRIYILGYRYKRTLANHKILEDRRQPGADAVRLNSHLVLLLGGMDGEWYGYHLFHDPDDHDASPFRVDALGSQYMTERFDMVTVWEVRGPELGLRETPVHMVNPAGQYAGVRRYLGLANRFGERASSIFDTAAMGLFGGSRQFPRVVRIPEAHTSPRVAINNPAVGRPARPTVNTTAARRPPPERQGRTAPAHISRRPAPPPRVGARNDRRRREHHAQHAPHARR